jgi:large subunit ribosomal protein L5
MGPLETKFNKQNNFYFSLIRFLEYKNHNQKLHNLSLFPQINTKLTPKISKIILNFSFNEVQFNKKKVLAFFFSMEVLSNQKPIGTVASTNILKWKLRKGMLVGCKVTLRTKNMFDFFENLILTLPRMEKFGVLAKKLFNKERTASLALSLSEIVFFYPMELGLGINSEVKKVELHFLFNTLNSEEKIFLLTSRRVPVEN